MLNKGFMGCIDEVRVWNRARTEEEIRINMEEYLTGNENNLTAYWKMNEGSGLEILDLTDNDNRGVLTECHYSDGIDFSIFSSVEEYDEVSAEVPGDYRLDQNYPNPFNPATTIEFLLPAGTNVHLAVYSISGELVATLADREFGAGSYRVVWNGRNKIGNDVASGIYFYRIMTESFSAVKKMMLVR
jgi:hypothetical protein